MLSRLISETRAARLLLLLLPALLAPLAAGASDYKIQPEDVLSIQVAGEAGLTNNYPLDEQGYVVLPMVGKVRLAGLNAKQAEEKLTMELGKFLKLFEVRVVVVGETGARALVYGEVSKQGQVKVREGAKLLDVLAEAGQPTANADRKRILVTRKADGKSTMVDLDAALNDAKLNLPIEPGDTITVPARTSRSIRVDGEVQAAGLKPLEEAKTAFAAVKSANPTPNADWSRIVMRRKGSDLPFTIDLAPVRSGTLKADIDLQEGDHLTVMSKFAGTARISGEVKAPGEKELNGPTQLLDFILTNGGGFTNLSDQMRVQVLRRDRPTAMVVNLVHVIKGVRRSDDPELQVLPGDVVFVPKGTVYVRGEVKTSGDLPLGTATNVFDFIMNGAGGFTEGADRRNVKIKRGDKEHAVNVIDIQVGVKSADAPEYAILPGDEITVPNDDPKRFVIVGGVSKPGRYPVTPGMTLLDAVGAAGNFSERATRKEFVVARADRFNADGSLKGAAAAPEVPKRGAKEVDPASLGLVVIDYKKLIKGDPAQNVAIHPGDRILIPEESANPKQRKPSFFDAILRMVPLATLFMGGYGFGGYGGGYGY